jgi:major membrane immunogen (membrane-anchored lipoprotein)
MNQFQSQPHVEGAETLESAMGISESRAKELQDIMDKTMDSGVSNSVDAMNMATEHSQNFQESMYIAFQLGAIVNQLNNPMNALSALLGGGKEQ